MTPPSPHLPVRVIDQEIRAFLSETKRSGPWTPGSTTFVKSTLAQINLDLRDAVLSAGEEVCVDVEVLLGSVTILIPPQWSVLQEVEVLLGSYEEDEERANTGQGTLRIIGRVRLGSVEVHRRLPGEGWLGAKRRRWRLRKGSDPKALPPG